MRSTTLHKRTIRMLRSRSGGVGTGAEAAAEMLQRLPVTVRHQAKKAALLRELRSIARQHDALCRRLVKATAAFERLPVERQASV
jgi:hypothetical protein